MKEQLSKRINEPSTWAGSALFLAGPPDFNTGVEWVDVALKVAFYIFAAFSMSFAEGTNK